MCIYDTMDARTQKRFEVRARIIKAMAHPTRLFIVDQLSKADRCVAELTDAVGADMSTVSKHLSILKEVGIVSDRKQGVQVYYALRTPCVLNFFSCVETVIHGNVQEDIERLKKS